MVKVTEEAIRIHVIEDLHRVRDHDESLRWELLCGELVVTPAPSMGHQTVVGQLLRLLQDACPAGLWAWAAPLDVELDNRTVLEPDVLVANPADFDDGQVLRVAPLLAVEVLSPSTRRRDLVTKPELLARAGCPAYWVVDPDEPSVTVWALGADGYHQVAQAQGDDVLRLDTPLALSFRPNDLVAPWRNRSGR